jgi:sporulation protein YlmC with PRC-barrel domain
MDIPIQADVECTDGRGGRSTGVVVNPVTRRVSHVVVEEDPFPHIKRLVPVALIAEASPDRICLKATKAALGEQESFLETHFVQGEFPYGMYDPDEVRLWPYALPDPGPVPVEYERLPPGELAVHRGSHVRATDGSVGQVDEFLVDRESGDITHLVLREGHLWGQKDVLIPVSEIERIEEDAVYLKMDKQALAQLPSMALQRWHQILAEDRGR